MEVSSIFVNRGKELEQITRAVEALQNKERLLETPFIEFSGVQGIGKSTLLRQIKALCDKRSVECILEEAVHVTPQAFNRAESLAEKEEPVVIILDSLDAIDSERFQDIETRLSKL